MLDKILDFGNGVQVSKKDYEDLFRLFKTEVSSGGHLNDKMLSCSGTERQNVALAFKFLHQDTANLIRQFFPVSAAAATDETIPGEKQDQAPAKEIRRDSKEFELKKNFDDYFDSDEFDSDGNDTMMNTAAATPVTRMTRRSLKTKGFKNFDDYFDSNGNEATMNTIGVKANDDSEITAEKQLNAVGKQTLADFMELMHKGFKLMSSYELYNPDPFRCAIGKHYDIQLPVLLEIKQMIKKIRFHAPVKVTPLKTKPKKPPPKRQTTKTAKTTKAKSTKRKVTKKKKSPKKGKFLVFLHTQFSSKSKSA